ncbi:hypothetical protein GVAV_002618 [Gurleya vavrai]
MLNLYYLSFISAGRFNDNVLIDESNRNYWNEGGNTGDLIVRRDVDFCMPRREYYERHDPCEERRDPCDERRDPCDKRRRDRCERRKDRCDSRNGFGDDDWIFMNNCSRRGDGTDALIYEVLGWRNGRNRGGYYNGGYHGGLGDHFNLRNCDRDFFNRPGSYSYRGGYNNPGIYGNYRGGRNCGPCDRF